MRYIFFLTIFTILVVKFGWIMGGEMNYVLVELQKIKISEVNQAIERLGK